MQQQDKELPLLKESVIVKQQPAEQQSETTTDASNTVSGGSKQTSGVQENNGVGGTAASDTADHNINNKRILCGNPEMVLKWFETIQTPCLYELIAQLIKVIPDKDDYERVIILRGSYGPVIKVMYFINDNTQMKDMSLGKWIRCVGYRLLDSMTLRAISVRDATEDEVAALPRIAYLCEQSVNLMKTSDA